MHELIAFLLGCCICCSGGYIWWTRRRFKAFKESFLAVLVRAEKLDNRYDNLDLRLDRARVIIERHTREITFLLADRVVPEVNETMVSEGKADQQQTVWERLRANVDDL
jgi:hypothetical protein